MRQFYINAIFATVVFLLVMLMHYLRHEALILHDLLTLGFWYAIGLVSAVLLGRPVVTEMQ